MFSLIASLANNLLGGVAGKVCDLISEKVEDKDLAAELNAALFTAIINTDLSKFVEQIKAQRDVLVAEIQGESWFQRNWRPITMMAFVAVVVNNYIVYDYLILILGEGSAAKLELPSFMWECIKLGLSGYIVGRSAEKIAAGTGLRGLKERILGGSAND